MDGVYVEENGVYQINLKSALWHFGNLNNFYANIGINVPNVDFIAETKDAIFLIEYKNTIIENAINPDAFDEKIRSKKFYQSMTRKYYGSMFYILACDKNKPVHFVGIIESKLMDDSFTRKRIESSIKARLPFDQHKHSNTPKLIVNTFKIYSVSEWNETFPMFPLTRCLS